MSQVHRPPRCRLCGKPLGCMCPRLPFRWAAQQRRDHHGM
ncbi:hypothetical protein Mx4_p40 [Myxococcus phage Mx4]|nr:hypothetical protein Mx4_p40 [Myxococcus phage Mx4]